MSKYKFAPSEDMTEADLQAMAEVVKRAGSQHLEVAKAALFELTQALTTPLQQGVLKGDIHSGIFETLMYPPGKSLEFPLDFLSPGTEKEHTAYTIPDVGRIPQRHVEGDYLMFSVYRVGNSIDFDLKYLEEVQWDIIGRAMQVLEAGFVRKDNFDAWATIMAAAAGRNLVVYDDKAADGLFSKRLVALMQTTMRRSAGGNSTSLNRGKLTDLFMSPEGHQDILTWDLTEIPEGLRQQIYTNWDQGGVSRIGSVALHDLDELGELQEFQNYLLAAVPNGLGASLPGTKKEFVIGLDLANDDAFVHPVRQKVRMFEDLTLHREGRAGMYAWKREGWSCLRSSRTLLGAF